MSATERFARAALELHRVALAATEVQHLPSPATPRERNAKGAADPTAGTALDPRRDAVAVTLSNVNGQVDALMADVLNSVASLTAALNAWDGRK